MEACCDNIKEKKSLTCHPDLSCPRQVEVWETRRVQGVDLGTMGVRLHPTTLLGVNDKEGQNRRRTQTNKYSNIQPFRRIADKVVVA